MKVAAGLLVAAGAIASLSAQTVQPVPQLQQPGVFRSSSALVALNVTVQDKNARFVAGLQPGDFAVYEDGVKQQVQFFESSAVPVDLIVLIDTSSSMSDKVAAVHDAASGFLRTMRDGDRGAVVAFANTVSVLQPLTSDRTLLEQAVRGTGARGSTSLNNAVYIALKEFGQPAHAAAAVRRQAIVVLSDGADTSSLVSFDDVLDLARQSGVNIYPLALQSMPPGAAPQRVGLSESDRSMKQLARETGGTAFFPDAGQLKAVYTGIAAELASQYSIGYVPLNGRSDGRFRHVAVQVVTRPDLRSRTRQGYTADGIAVAAGMGGGR